MRWDPWKNIVKLLMVEHQLGKDQCGYQRYRSTIDLNFALRIKKKILWEFNKMHFVFIDLKRYLVRYLEENYEGIYGVRKKGWGEL